MLLGALLLVAAFSAVVRVLANWHLTWAAELLARDIAWSDTVLRTGTLWLAFLGASLAAYHRKHVRLDAMLATAPPRSRARMLAGASFATALIALGLVVAFGQAVRSNLAERPAEYELLRPDGTVVHLCDAQPAELATVPGLVRPALFCGVRSVLGACGVQAETPGAAAQLFVPVMLLVVALRFLAHGVRGLIGERPDAENAP